MGIVRGAQAIKDAAEPRTPSVEFKWFKLEDGESVKVRFLQEIDYDAPGYSEKNDVGFMATIINPPGPEGWKHRFVLDEENEGLLLRIKDWPKKQRFYINMLVERDGEWVQEVWDTSKANVRQLLEWSAELGGLTKNDFKITRSGKGTSTNYIIMGKAEAEFDPEEYEMVNVEERFLTPLTPDVVNTFSTDVDDSPNWMG